MQILSQLVRVTRSGVVGVWDVSMAGRYFRLLDAGAAVSVIFYRDGREVGRADEIVAGFWYEAAPSEAFDRVVMTTTASQFMRVLLANGRGGYDGQAPTRAVEPAVSGGDLQILRLTISLMYPTMTADELDIAMMFVDPAGGYASSQQAIFAAEQGVQAATPELRAALLSFT